jgi:hypothetical protein
LKVGGGCGGGGSGNCACACSVARLKKATHPATKIPASAIRSNLVVCIAVSFEPMYRPSPFGLTTRLSILRFPVNRRARGWAMGRAMVLPFAEEGAKVLSGDGLQVQ